MPKLLLHFTVWLTKKEAIWWSGLPNTSAWAQKHRDVSLSMKLKWLPLLKPHLKHSLRLKVCCEVLTIYEKFSISCVKLTIFLHPIALISVNSLSVVCIDCIRAYSWRGSAFSQCETGRSWLRDVAGTWLSGVTMGRRHHCHLDTHTHNTQTH